MGPLQARLPSWAPAGKALRELAGRQGPLDTPVGGNRGERLKDEASVGELGMRDCQSTRSPIPTAPQHKVQVENPGSPATPAAAAKFPLHQFETLQHCWRLEVTLNQRDGIREISTRTAVRSVQDDW